MVQPEFARASPNAHLLIGQMPAAHQLHGRAWGGTGVSVAAHAILFGVLGYAATHVSQVAQIPVGVTERLKVVFLNGAGAGNEDGRNGPATTDPPRPAPLSPAKPIEIAPAANPIDTPPAPEMAIPVVTLQTQQMLPGTSVQADVRFAGRPGGDGRGPGTGPGDGPGSGPGTLNGHGDFGRGIGASSPRLITEVKPLYTVEAMRAKLQGAVEMEAVVLPNGAVDPASIRITRSLDSVFGLDEQAIIAVKQWRFRPGTFKGQAVAARVTVELTFTLR